MPIVHGIGDKREHVSVDGKQLTSPIEAQNSTSSQVTSALPVIKLKGKWKNGIYAL